ncbi:hypothetical protein BS78_02G060700 [Paspalum vaginatum]|nr:hypothetical protein BS78_02G060700 [Paspalum vaginatum]
MDGPKTMSSEVTAPCPSDEAVVEILSRLHAKPLFRFKCVSKTWHGLITDRLRCRKFPQTLQGFFSGDRGVNYGDHIDLSGRPVPLVDPCFSFLTKLPGIEKIVLLGSCNGLVLFGNRRVTDSYDSLGYIVCNPATEQWVAVPSSGWTPWEDGEDKEDPGDVSELWLVGLYHLEEVHTFSSVTGAWKRHQGIEGKAWFQWGLDAFVASVACPFNGMLHVSIRCEEQNMIVEVDGEGKPFKTMHWPANRGRIVLVGQSQGHLHCVSGRMEHKLVDMTELSIWVLEDYDADKWLFGKISGRFRFHWDVVAIHPYRGLLFFVDQWNWKLISYDMDKKEVRAICSLGHDHRRCNTQSQQHLLRSTEIVACGLLCGMSSNNLIFQWSS